MREATGPGHAHPAATASSLSRRRELLPVRAISGTRMGSALLPHCSHLTGSERVSAGPVLLIFLCLRPT
jgi:hypothetical protein